MKKTIVMATVLMSLVSTSLIPLPDQRAYASTTVVATATLTPGMSGERIATLQRDLTTLGYFTNPTVTGYFGSITSQAVRSFQQAYRLPQTGFADPATRSAVAQALVKNRLIQDASQYIRVPYLWGGSTPSGFDCSGFIHYMFRKHGIPSIRTTAAKLFTTGMAIGKPALQPGDLVFFSINSSDPKAVTHVGFYIGNGQFISALSSVGIYVQKMDNSYWGPKYLGARRIFWDVQAR